MSGLGAADHRQHLGAGVAFSDHLEVRRLFERALHTLYDQPMVVGDENFHGRILVRRPVDPECAAL
jgi:hypothetical protein